MSPPIWHISTDTGGTFTDALGVDPSGRWHRTKVLSSGSIRLEVQPADPLRGRREASGPDWFRFRKLWQGHDGALPGMIVTSSEGREIGRVRSVEGDVMQVDVAAAADIAPVADTAARAAPAGADQRDAPVPSGATLALSTGEPPPLLAARLLTGTPPGHPLPTMELRVGTTRGTNALLERAGADVCFLVTEGWRDALDIGTQQRPDLFALDIRKPAALTTGIVEVPERVAADGSVVTPLTELALNQMVDRARSAGAASYAICLINSYRNDAHERALAEALEGAGLRVVRSTELSPAINHLQRSRTVVVEAYLGPVMDRFIGDVRRGAPDARLRLMTSAGGLEDAQTFRAKDSLLSGPAGGVVGALGVGEESGAGRVITFDMGGTSTDVSRCDGAVDYRFLTRVGDTVLSSPSVHVETVAAGGGSICRMQDGRLTVGPDSAGASPGAASYGAGGPLTLTDVNVLLGRVEPESFGVPIDPRAAEKAFRVSCEIQDDKSLADNTLRVALHGFLDIANERMAEAIREISVRRGYDPAEYALVAFGGAGGQHACAVADMLGINRVLSPDDAGLLSAVGISKAPVERFASRLVLRPLFAADSDLDATRRGAEQEAERALRSELTDGSRVSVSTIARLRLAGQEHAIDVPWAASTEGLSAAFRTRYESMYGHWIEGRDIEVASLHSVARWRPDPPAEDAKRGESGAAPASGAIVPVALARRTLFGPVHQRARLPTGTSVHGPALITGPFDTLVVEAGWVARRTRGNVILVTRRAAGKAGSGSSDRAGNRHEQPAEPGAVDTSAAARLELFSGRFSAVADEMGAMLERTAFSVNVKERLDFSCALLDPKGYLVANAPHIPVHLGALGVCVRSVLKAVDPGPGDVIVTNHPAFGGSHLPDVTLIAPVFRNERLVGFVANRCHHAEIGGRRPGSMPAEAACLAEEGVVIPPAFLVRDGRVLWDEMNDRLAAGPWPSRAPRENTADLRAALASVAAGRAALERLCAHCGDDAVAEHMEAVQAFSGRCVGEALTGTRLARSPVVEELDDGSMISVRLRHTAEGLLVDFEGSAPVHPGNMNATPAIVTSAVVYVLRLLTGRDLPLNEGFLRPVRLHVPAGMLNPDFSGAPERAPAVVGGNVETSQRVVDALLRAFGIAACSQGTMNNVVFGTDAFGYYETIAGGTGAGPGFHGASGVHQHMTNTRITDPEVMELRYPVRVHRFGLRPGSGGAGRWTGGDGIIREIEFLEPVELSILSQHRRVAPYGMGGGRPGRVGAQRLVRSGGAVLPLEGIVSVVVGAGDRLVIETPGGGGWGAPTDRTN